MSTASYPRPSASLHAELLANGVLSLAVVGHLDAHTTASLWRDSMRELDRHPTKKVVLDASQIAYCDGAGIALLQGLRLRLANARGTLEIHSLPISVQHMMDLYGEVVPNTSSLNGTERTSLVESTGRASLNLMQDVHSLITFIGALSYALLLAIRYPSRVKWKDVGLTAELVGVNALPIVALIGFLLGLIMGFQSAIPMRRFGADLYVAHLLGLSVIRELGPLITAIILAGRSGSAFAAELGSMKVNEEIDALRTMGLEPIPFLAVPRVVATVLMTPLLTVFASLFALIGGLMVMQSLGFTLMTYVDALQSVIRPGDLLGGWIKSFAFGLVVAGIGCMRGLQTKSGASAVGKSATKAVVSGLILIAVVDGIFAVIYYSLGL